MDNSEDKSHGESDSLQQLKDLKSNKIVDHEDQVILTKESYNSTSVSVTGLTSTGTFLQGLFLQYLHETVITILCLHHLYKGISMVSSIQARPEPPTLTFLLSGSLPISLLQ